MSVATGLAIDRWSTPCRWLFTLFEVSQQQGAQAEQDFIDERNEIGDDQIQSEQDGCHHEQAWVAESSEEAHNWGKKWIRHVIYT